MDFSKAFKRLIMLARNKNSSVRGAQSGGAGLSVSITVMPDFSYGLSVYGASSSDHNNVQHFSDRYCKSRYISRKLNVRELLERSDCVFLQRY